MEDLITIIVPVYNVEQYLEKCLDSIINQTYKKLEILLVDDGSTDASGKICDLYAEKDHRIKVVHKKNGGVSSARNVALNIASGSYIHFIDADDYIELNMIETLYHYIKRDDYDIAICNVNFIKHAVVSPHVIEKKCETVLNQSQFIGMLFGEEWYRGYLVNKLIKRECIGSIRLNEEIHMMEDLVFLVKISSNVSKVYFDKTAYLYYYVQRESSVSHFFESEKYFSIIKAFEEIIPYIGICDYDTKNTILFDYISYIMTYYYYCYYFDKITFQKEKKQLLKKRNQYMYQAMHQHHYSIFQKIKLCILAYAPLGYGRLKLIKDKKQQSFFYNKA